MLSDADNRWFDLQEKLQSSEGDGPIVLDSEELPESIMAGFRGITVPRTVIFRGVTFPDGGPDGFSFSGVTFKQSVYFENCSFKGKYPRFSQCDFVDLTFMGCRKMPKIVFLSGCIVRGRMLLRDCAFDCLHILPGEEGTPEFKGRVDIEDCSFQELCLLQGDCRSLWYIIGTTFQRKLSLSCSCFSSWLWLDRVTVMASPPKPPGEFQDGLSIGECTLAGGMILNGLVCEGDFALFNTTIDGSLRLIKTALNRGVTFVSINRGTKGECDIANLSAKQPGALEAIYRYGKVAKTDQGDVDAAGNYCYLERSEHNAAARAARRWAPWPRLEWVVGKLLLGYGEKPLRPLGWAVGTIMFFAWLFWILGAVAPGGSSFGDCLYFSVVTFTTLGYGDLHPNPGNPRLLAGAEAVLGVALMSLFLVVLARKFIR